MISLSDATSHIWASNDSFKMLVCPIHNSENGWRCVVVSVAWLLSYTALREFVHSRTKLYFISVFLNTYTSIDYVTIPTRVISC